MNELASGLPGCFSRLQAGWYVLVCVVDLRRLRCYALGGDAALSLRPLRWHSLHEVMQVQVWTVDLRNLLAVLAICCRSCTKVLGRRPAVIIQYNSSRRGYAYYYVYVHTQKNIGTLVARNSDLKKHIPLCMHLVLDWRHNSNIQVGYQHCSLHHRADHELSTRRRFSRSS